MATLDTIATWKEAYCYLDNLKKTIHSDIRPLLETPDGAPFAISREVLSYVDHLGHLYTGKENIGERIRDYLRQMMSKIDPNYGERAEIIYQMYRNGPVHEFEPKVLENRKGQLLYWFCSRGGRICNYPFPEKVTVVKHLEPVNRFGDHQFWLPVSTRCLINDLVGSIEEFKRAGPKNERVTAWNRAARQLIFPKPFDFEIK